MRLQFLCPDVMIGRTSLWRNSGVFGTSTPDAGKADDDASEASDAPPSDDKPDMLQFKSHM